MKLVLCAELLEPDAADHNGRALQPLRGDDQQPEGGQGQGDPQPQGKGLCWLCAGTAAPALGAPEIFHRHFLGVFWLCSYFTHRHC